MIKVLIVDDDLLVRNSLHNMIDWQKYGFIICGEASNGKYAIDMIKEYNPNIVMLDISMPIMDGIELSNYIKEHHKEIKMVILSSYDNFDYVRRTLKNGAIDYLLKHKLEPKELCRVLKKVEKLIVDESKEKENIEVVKKKYEQIREMARENYIKDLVLNTKSSNQDIEEYIKLLQFNIDKTNIVAVAMQVYNFSIIIDNYDDNESNRLINSITHLCLQIIDERKNGIISYLHQGRFVILFSFEKLRSESEIYSIISNVLEKINISLNRYLNIQVLFGTSNIFSDYEDIPIFYKKASEKFKTQLNVGKNNEENEQTSIINLSITKEKKLLQAIDDMDIYGVYEVIDQVFTSLSEKVNYLSAQIIVGELISIATKFMNEVGFDIRAISQHEKLTKENIKNKNECEEVYKWIKELYTELLDIMRSKKNDKIRSKYVNNAASYIEKNYRRDISLNEVAEKIGISPSYLSRLFKEDTGESFIDYLRVLRVEAAKKLIKNRESKINEIYEKVGFNSYNYFFKVFKEITGVTPQRYSKNNFK